MFFRVVLRDVHMVPTDKHEKRWGIESKIGFFGRWEPQFTSFSTKNGALSYLWMVKQGIIPKRFTIDSTGRIKEIPND